MSIDDQERQDNALALEDEQAYIAARKSLSTADLIQEALANPDDDSAYNPIYLLHVQGGDEVFAQARALCLSDDPNARRVGALVLGQHDAVSNDPSPAQHEESVTLLLAMLARETDPVALSAITIALGHRRDARAVHPLATLKDHPDDGVRFGVAFGLGSMHEEPEAIEALIALMTDVDSDVRDWATFGLGALSDADSPRLRDALAARLDDPDADTRGEALVGLARRHDERAFAPLLAVLNASSVGVLDLEAAEEFGDPRLYPALLRIQKRWPEPHEYPYQILEGALESCRPA